MARENEITTSFNVDISELKKGIQEAQRQIRLANAEFKAASSGMDQWDKSAEGIQAKLKQLNTVLENQKKVLKAYEDQLSEIVKEQGENSKQADEMRIKIANQQAAINNTTKEINKWEGALDDVGKELDEDGKKVGEFDDSLEDTTKGGLNAFTVALGNLASNVITSVISKLKDMITQTLEVGKQFDSSMANVAALSGATAEELAMLRDTAKEFGSTTKFSASEAADALGYMALAGWDAQQSADALGGVLDLAASSGMGLAEASDMVTDYMSAFNMAASDSTRFADMMAYAQANANTTTEGLGEAFKNCAANLNAAGQDIETTTSLLAMMANQGLKGSRAGTALSAVMRDITKSMDEGAISISNTSVAVMDADGNYRDLTDILRDVEAATAGMGDAEKASALSATFTADSIKGLNLILNAGVDSAADFEKALRDSGGSASEMAKIMNDNLGGDLTALNSKLEGVQIAIYEKFEPALRKGVEALSGVLDVINFIVEHSTEFITALGAMAAGIAAYLAYTTAVKVMTEGWAALTIVTKAQAAAQAVLNAVMSANPIGIVIAAITALVAAFVLLWNKSEAFREFWIDLWNGLVIMVEDAWAAIKGFFEGAWEFVTGLWGQITDFFTNIWESVKAIFSGIAQWVNDNVFKPIMKFFEPVIRFFKEAFAIIKGLAEGCWTTIKLLWKVAADWFNKNVIEPVKKFFTGLWEGIASAARTAWDTIKGIWEPIANWFNTTIIVPVTKFFSGMWDGLVKGASDAWEGIKKVFSVITDWFRDVFTEAWTAVKNVFSTGGEIFTGIVDGIADAFKNIVNAIIGGINAVISIPFNAINNTLDKIRQVEILGIHPFSFIKKFTVPEIPKLAQGGILKKGQLGLLEGDGAEAVVPLDQNKRWISATAQAMKAALAAEGVIVNGAGSVTNNYNFTQNNTSPKALSRLEIYRQTNNVLQFAKGV